MCIRSHYIKNNFTEYIQVVVGLLYVINLIAGFEIDGDKRSTTLWNDGNIAAYRDSV